MRSRSIDDGQACYFGFTLRRKSTEVAVHGRGDSDYYPKISPVEISQSDQQPVTKYYGTQHAGHQSDEGPNQEVTKRIPKVPANRLTIVIRRNWQHSYNHNRVDPTAFKFRRNGIECGIGRSQRAR
jgi:hypothetical protein